MVLEKGKITGYQSKFGKIPLLPYYHICRINFWSRLIIDFFYPIQFSCHLVCRLEPYVRFRQCKLESASQSSDGFPSDNSIVSTFINYTPKSGFGQLIKYWSKTGVKSILAFFTACNFDLLVVDCLVNKIPSQPSLRSFASAHAIIDDLPNGMEQIGLPL